MLFIFIVLFVSALVYIPYRRDINELTRSSYRLLQLRSQKRRSDRELQRNPPPSYEEIFREQSKKKQLERQKEKTEWHNQFNALLPPEPSLVKSTDSIDATMITAGSVTSDSIRVIKQELDLYSWFTQKQMWSTAISKPTSAITHENFDTYEVRSVDGTDSHSWSTPTTPDVHSASERCYRCK